MDQHQHQHQQFQYAQQAAAAAAPSSSAPAPAPVYGMATAPPVAVAYGMQPQAQAQAQAQAQSQSMQLASFWRYQMAEVEGVGEFKSHQQLPLARIKKIMKADEDVRMISAEAPVLFAKACEMFILELTLRSWIHAEENKRRTLQKNDIAAAITRTDIFDFLVDIVPRDELQLLGPTPQPPPPAAAAAPARLPDDPSAGAYFYAAPPPPGPVIMARPADPYLHARPYGVPMYPPHLPDGQVGLPYAADGQLPYEHEHAAPPASSSSSEQQHQQSYEAAAVAPPPLPPPSSQSQPESAA